MQSKELTSADRTPEAIDRFARVLAAPQQHILYLEDVDYLPKDLQEQLLDIFSIRHSTAPPWVIVSSVEPLENAVQKSNFSPALLKMLDTVHIALPPLRAKPDSIPQMLYWLMNQNNGQDNFRRLSIPDMDTIEHLIHYHWPGNWEQLQRVTRAAFITKGWDFALNSFNFLGDQDESQINDMAAIYILSLAKLNIQKEMVMEGLMTSSNLDEIGLLDLAIFHEAVSQISDHICGNDPDQEESRNFT